MVISGLGPRTCVMPAGMWRVGHEVLEALWSYLDLGEITGLKFE